MRKFVHLTGLEAELKDAHEDIRALKKQLSEARYELRRLRGKVSDQAHVIAVGDYWERYRTAQRSTRR